MQTESVLAQSQRSRWVTAGRVLIGFAGTCVLVAATCPTPVKVPPSAAQDQAPTVNIGYMKKTAPNQPNGDFASATQGGPLNLPTADVNSTYLLTASANDPKGGVKIITLVVGQGTKALQTITNSQTEDANGAALPSLSIIGTNGSGGPGAGGIEVRVGNNPPLNATVTATNFNGQTTTMTVIFNVIAGPPTISDFSVTPNDHDPSLGYINAGSSATLSWNVSCGIGVGGCNVAIRGIDVNNNNQTLFLPALGFSGTFKVTPAQNSKYTLTVTNAGGGNLATSKPVTVNLYTPPSMNGLQPFYFKMSCNSTVTSCFTIAVWAQNESQAQQLAEQQNGGCTATSISAQDFVNGC